MLSLFLAIVVVAVATDSPYRYGGKNSQYYGNYNAYNKDNHNQGAAHGRTIDDRAHHEGSDKWGNHRSIQGTYGNAYALFGSSASQRGYNPGPHHGNAYPQAGLNEVFRQAHRGFTRLGAY